MADASDSDSSSENSYNEATAALASAFDQIDSIISSAKLDNNANWAPTAVIHPLLPAGSAAPSSAPPPNSFGGSLTSSSSSTSANLQFECDRLVRQLADRLFHTGNFLPTAPQDPAIRALLTRWLDIPYNNSNFDGGMQKTTALDHQVRSRSPSIGGFVGDMTETVNRLQSDRESMALQITVLSEQVSAQQEKIRDLEQALSDKRNRLDSTEELLQEELVTRSGLETSKLDLMAQISELKLRLAALEKSRLAGDSRLRSAMAECAHLRQMLHQRESELHLLRIGTNNFDSMNETEQLKVLVHQLMTNNVDKDRRLAQMERMLGVGVPSGSLPTKHQLADEAYLPGVHAAAVGSLQRSQSSQSAGAHSLDQYGTEEIATLDAAGYTNTLPAGVGMSTSYHNHIPQSASYTYGFRMQQQSAPNTPHRSRTPQQQAQQLVNELRELNTAYRERSNSKTSENTKEHSFKKFLKRWPSSNAKRSTSVPDLGHAPPRAPAFNRLIQSHSNTSASESESDDRPQPNSQRRYSDNFRRTDRKRRSSFRQLLGKLKRSTSQEWHGQADLGDANKFTRNGVTRATAVPRLGTSNWMQQQDSSRGQTTARSLNTQDIPQWSSDRVADWLLQLGLDEYASEARRNPRLNGRWLLNASEQHLEKDLNVKHWQHRRKIILVIRAIQGGYVLPGFRMDCEQTLRWLDDIGLSQYRQVVQDAKIDGILLCDLCIGDLLQLKINSAMHQASLARGIQLLREHNFALARLQRKYRASSGIGGSSEIVLWTAHAVSEWLRSIDLAEFTPNLLGAGVHGALMTLEPSFTAESLASVLQIPAQKTLLRRHLTTHFNLMLGAELIASKRQALAQDGGMSPLYPSVKVKALKKTFSLPRKKKGATKDELLVNPDLPLCPPDCTVSLISGGASLAFDAEDEAELKRQGVPIFGPSSLPSNGIVGQQATENSSSAMNSLGELPANNAVQAILLQTLSASNV